MNGLAASDCISTVDVRDVMTAGPAVDDVENDSARVAVRIARREDPVVAGAAEENVRVRPAAQDVVPRVPVEDIPPGAASEVVGAGAAGQRVVE